MCDFGKPWFTWRPEGQDILGVKITPREWDWIVRPLVTRLTDEQIETWVSHVRTLVGGNLHDMPRRTWQTGVLALSKTLNIPIE